MQQSNGFTLVEVLVALALVALLAAAAWRCSAVSAGKLVSARLRTQALSLAATQMERALLVEWPPPQTSGEEGPFSWNIGLDDQQCLWVRVTWQHYGRLQQVELVNYYVAPRT